MKYSIVDMLLTSLVNNDSLLNKTIEDVYARFNTKLDKDKLRTYLDTVEVTVKESINVN